MEGVDHVDVREVDGRGFVGEVDGVDQGEIPDREGLELRVARFHAALVVVIELGEAGRHLAAARSGGGDDDELAGGFDVFVLPVALVADDVLHVGGIAFDREVLEDAQAEVGEAHDEGVRGGLSGVVRDDDRADVETAVAEGIDEAESVHVVGDAEVRAHLVLFDGDCGDDDDDLRLVTELEEHVDLAVRFEAGQDARGVVVVEELAAEFEVELAAEFGETVADAFGLEGQILLVVKSFFEHVELP